MNNNADCRICHRLIRGFDDICLSCWSGIEESEARREGDDALSLQASYYTPA